MFAAEFISGEFKVKSRIYHCIGHQFGVTNSMFKQQSDSGTVIRPNNSPELTKTGKTLQSQFQLHHSPCLVSTVQAWGVIYLHILSLLLPIEHHLNATAYPRIAAHYFNPFMMATHHPLMAVSSRMMQLVTTLKSSPTAFFNVTVSFKDLHHQISS